ncbi:alpha/beta fold hydrolase [Microbacteriaceae bacterium VKM Ac-2855]|nr:alpha/beta fold hydrolase [Microbacteriaceae bacterium VKM Ac-2855]
MAHFLLIPGAGGDAWYWHRVAPALEAAGHTAIAVPLPAGDENAGIEEYAEVAVTAVDECGADPSVRWIVVGQSLGAFTAVALVERIPVEMLVFVCAMVPLPGETPGQWWQATGQEAARVAADLAAGRDPERAFDPLEVFLHDVPVQVVGEALAGGEFPQSAGPFASVWAPRPWSGIPVRAVIGLEDRFFPPAFARHLVRERLHLEPDAIACGHLPALAAPRELTALLERYADDVGAAAR